MWKKEPEGKKAKLLLSLDHILLVTIALNGVNALLCLFTPLPGRSIFHLSMAAMNMLTRELVIEDEREDGSGRWNGERREDDT